MAFRLSGVPLFSWLGLCGLLVAIGIATAASADAAAQLLIGAVCAALGIVIATGTLRVAVVISEAEIKIRNRFRSFHVPLDDVAEVASRVVETPMTRANGWGQIELRDAHGRQVRMVASTGLSPEKTRRLLDYVTERSPTTTILVDESDFPTVGSRRPYDNDANESGRP